jgi:hypothetical protein
MYLIPQGEKLCDAANDKERGPVFSVQGSARAAARASLFRPEAPLRAGASRARSWALEANGGSCRGVYHRVPQQACQGGAGGNSEINTSFTFQLAEVAHFAFHCGAVHNAAVALQMFDEIPAVRCTQFKLGAYSRPLIAPSVLPRRAPRLGSREVQHRI